MLIGKYLVYGFPIDQSNSPHYVAVIDGNICNDRHYTKKGNGAALQEHNLIRPLTVENFKSSFFNDKTSFVCYKILSKEEENMKSAHKRKDPGELLKMVNKKRRQTKFKKKFDEKILKKYIAATTMCATNVASTTDNKQKMSRSQKNRQKKKLKKSNMDKIC